jgi:shikimate kinase
MHSNKNKLILAGFMGAGKSSFLQKLQKNGASYQFIDLDQEISGNLAELIENVGWDSFRQMEQDLLRDLMDSEEKMVIALGGGAFRESLVIEGITIWLDIPFDVCFERIKESRDRPLAKLSREELEKLYDERALIYQNCEYVLNLDQLQEINSLKDLFSHLGLT